MYFMLVVLNGRRETLSQSKSLKADKDLMWKKLATPSRPRNWTDGLSKGEVVMFMAGRSMGKSTMAFQSLGRAMRELKK